MKKLLYILFPILGFSIMYLPCAFAYVSFNIEDWDFQARIGCAVVGTMLACIGIVISAYINNN